ncbi:tetratricopeptide repeat protein [Paraburkholderia bannensis]|uniref:tetratricopeptide repeat protein n=1 Tax=Paraburkholderia bannensis TaxID=765414 RepID=UPI002ABDED78|nr:hypothetical protein [Paraburkholderia bannensis]
MKELPQNIQDKVEVLSEQGNVLCDESEFSKAIQQWRTAIALLPEPQVDWEAYTWLAASIGDAQYQLEDLEAACQSFFDALDGPEGMQNPFVHYRLGQCQIKLGHVEHGVQSLLKAYMLEGEDIFDEDHEGASFLKILRDKKLID